MRNLLLCSLVLAAAFGNAAFAKGKVEYLNPKGLHKNPAFSQVAVASGDVKTIYVGGQNAVDVAGKVVGKGDLKAQTAKAIENVEIALHGAGAKLENVVRWNVHMVQGQPLKDGAETFQKAWGDRPDPPTVTVLIVPGLANPEFLVEIDAIAVVP